MYVTTGTIDSLIAWFESDHARYKFLCLLVAGDPNDSQFFADVFDKKGIIDVLSGEEIAVFLFAPEQSDFLWVETGEGSAKVLAGHIVNPRRPDFGAYFHAYGLPHRQVSKVVAADLHNYHPIREQIVMASQDTSHQICSKFHLEPDDVPCILLIAKGEPEPFVIRTSAQADVAGLCNFIRDTREIARLLPTIYDLEWSIEVTSMLVAAEKEASTLLWVTEAESKFQASIDNLCTLLEGYGIPRHVCSKLFNLQSARSVWQTLGLVPGAPKPLLALEYSEAFQRAVDEGELKRIAREVAYCAKQLDAARHRRASSIAKVDKSVSGWENARSVIGDLCRRYETVFAQKSQRRPIEQLPGSLLGFSKISNAMTAVEATAKRLRESRRPIESTPRVLHGTHVFVSYSPKDEQWLRRLQVHLAPLIRSELVDLWDTTRVTPGALWRIEVERALSVARIAVLLVSPDWLASEFVHTNELTPIITKAESKGLRVLSVVVGPSLFRHHELSRYQPVNDPDRPLNSLPPSEAEETLVKVAELIKQLAEEDAANS